MHFRRRERRARAVLVGFRSPRGFVHLWNRPPAGYPASRDPCCHPVRQPLTRATWNDGQHPTGRHQGQATAQQERSGRALPVPRKTCEQARRERGHTDGPVEEAEGGPAQVGGDQVGHEGAGRPLECLVVESVAEIEDPDTPGRGSKGGAQVDQRINNPIRDNEAAPSKPVRDAPPGVELSVTTRLKAAKATKSSAG